MAVNGRLPATVPSASASQLPTYAIDSVDKALQVVLMLRGRPWVRVVDVSSELGVARSTAHRLLSTLVHRGFALRDPLTRNYRAGPQNLVPSRAPASGELVREMARAELRELSAELRETVNLVTLEGRCCRFIDQVDSDPPLRTLVRPGALIPAHSTSGGKALLAELSESEVHDLYPHGLRRLTPHTMVDIDSLARELGRIRETGYAVNRGESEAGVSAVAIAVRDGAQAVAAVAVSVPSLRVTEAELHSLIKPLRKTAQRIGVALRFS